MMTVLRGKFDSLHPSPEHEDSEFYALPPKIGVLGVRVIEGRMRNACDALLAKRAVLKSIHLPDEAPNSDSLSAFLKISSSEGI